MRLSRFTCRLVAPFIVLLFWGAGPLLAEDDPAPIVIAVDEANPPLMYGTETGARGMYPALIREIFRRIDRPVSVEAMPWKRAFLLADSGKVGIAGLVKTVERQRRFDFTDPLYEDVLKIYVRQERTFSYTGIDSLKDKKIGVLRGWSYGDAFDRARADGWFIAEEVSGDAQNVDKLINSRIDAALMQEEVGGAALASADAVGQIVPLNDFVRLPVYIAFHAKAGQRPLIERINAALDGMRQDSTYAAILSSITGP